MSKSSAPPLAQRASLDRGEKQDWVWAAGRQWLSDGPWRLGAAARRRTDLLLVSEYG